MSNSYKRLVAALLAAVMIFSLAACGDDEAHPENEIIEFTLAAEPLTLDPQIASDYASVMLITNLFEGLVRKRADGSIGAGMAETWDVAENGTKYTFSLCKNTRWSDGTPVTADDFVFGMTRSLDPETRSENAPDLFLIKNASAFSQNKASSDSLGIKAPDTETLEITLEYPSDNLLEVLTQPVAMPCCEEFFKTAKGKYGKEPELLITNGPFRIRENYGWDHNKYIYIRRSEEYSGSNKAVPLGVNFTIAQPPADPIAAITSGRVDICEIYGNQLLRAKENELPVETTCSTLWGICYNTDIMAFKNAKLRVALFGSLDRKDLLADVPESYIKTSQLISDSVSFGGRNYRGSVGTFSLDRADDPPHMFRKAVEELDEKGIELKSSYTIVHLDDDASSRIVTQLITKWNEITGCYFNKEALSRSELEQRISTGDYEIAIAPLNTSVDSPMEFFSSLRSDSKNNSINLNYPAYDGFIDKALSSTDVDETISSLSSAESYLIEYGYLFPLYYESRYFASAVNVSGAVFDTGSDAIDFTQVKKIRKD